MVEREAHPSTLWASQAVRIIAFESWELWSVVINEKLSFASMDTAINSYRVCHLERQIAIVSIIVQSQSFK